MAAEHIHIGGCPPSAILAYRVVGVVLAAVGSQPTTSTYQPPKVVIE